MEDPGSEQERIVIKEQIKVLDILTDWSNERKQRANELPRLGHIEMGEGVVEPQTQNESVSKESALENETRAEDVFGEGDEGNAPAHNRRRCDKVLPYVE